MNQFEERLESLEQVIEALISQFKGLEEPLREILQTKTPNYDQALEEIFGVLDMAHKNQEITELKSAVKLLTEKVNTIPNPIRIQTKNSFDIKSKFFFWGAVVVFLSVAISTGLAVFFGVRNAELASEAEKYTIVRAYEPETVLGIDSAYLVNKDNVMNEARLMIIEQKTLSEAKYKEVVAKREYEQAQEASRKLAKKKKKK